MAKDNFMKLRIGTTNYRIPTNALEEYKVGRNALGQASKLRADCTRTVVVGEKPVMQKGGQIIFSAETVVCDR